MYKKGMRFCHYHNCCLGVSLKIKLIVMIAAEILLSIEMKSKIKKFVRRKETETSINHGGKTVCCCATSGFQLLQITLRLSHFRAIPSEMKLRINGEMVKRKINSYIYVRVFVSATYETHNVYLMFRILGIVEFEKTNTNERTISSAPNIIHTAYLYFRCSKKTRRWKRRWIEFHRWTRERNECKEIRRIRWRFSSRVQLSPILSDLHKSSSDCSSNWFFPATAPSSDFCIGHSRVQYASASTRI